jgi:hypothetical protein
MNHSGKKDRNKSYYERNKERILEKARLKALEKSPSSLIEKGSVVSLFKNPEPNVAKKTKSEKQRSKIFKMPWIESGYFFLLVLVGCMTSFLFHETSKFFLVLDQNWGGACLKAGILEGAAIAFSIMQGRDGWGVRLNRMMVALIYGFGIWVVSYPIVSSAQSQHNQTAIHQKTINELEGEISKKESIRDQYWQQDRVTLARRYDQSLEVLRTQLGVARNMIIGLPSEVMLKGVLLAGILFRILIMISNFACIQYLRNRKSIDM